MKRKIWILTLITLLCCNLSAQKYAEEFLNNQRSKQTCEKIYLRPASELIKTDIITLDSVNDSTVLSIFNQELINSLKFYGFEVEQVQNYPSNLKDNEHTLEISQIELEEYPFYDSITDDMNPKQKFYKQLSGVKVNVWLTYNAQKTEDKLIFYNERQIQSAIDGYFYQDNSKETFVTYQTVDVNPNDVYLITDDNAAMCAEYFFNFLLNRYVYFKTNGEDKNFYGISDHRTLITKKYPFAAFELLEQ
ncbi:MAG: hypothetical protein J6P44_04460 [Bacteroidales bacterium]|nr:hypothetical protein [Bacteroidales bacterium]